MKKLLWKLNRLRTMTLCEVLHRVGTALQTRLESRGIGLANDPPAPAFDFGRDWLPKSRAFNVEAYRSAADTILSGRFAVFALESAELGFPPDWNRDPRTGIVAPLRFGKRIDYRDEQVVGDIKYLWQPNRHLELVTLAQAFHLTGEFR